MWIYFYAGIDRFDVNWFELVCTQGLVDFMYTGEMNLDQRSVQDILVAADMIQLKEVN